MPIERILTTTGIATDPVVPLTGAELSFQVTLKALVWQPTLLNKNWLRAWFCSPRSATRTLVRVL